MRKALSLGVFRLILICTVATGSQSVAAQALEPIVYTVKLPAPDTHVAEVEAAYPTGSKASIEVMMPMWTPGFYKVENYSGKIQTLTARAANGIALQVDQPKKNRWHIQTAGAPAVILSYKLLCTGRSVTTNWVGEDLLVLNGGAAFPTLVDKARRPHDVHLVLPAKWKQSMTGLDAGPDGKPHHYRAPDFDTLVDSPILAGNLDVQDFVVDGSKHFLVAAGDIAQWDGKRAAVDLARIVQENRRMWGFLPFQKYVFLCVLRQGGGGLEHKNSTLVTTNPGAMRTAASYASWLGLVSHEYFHAFNVKRLRPVELGPFDYEKEPRTTGLWIAEGLTSYYGDIILPRAGLGGSKDFLARLSSHIDKLQKSPGRLVQSLEQASYDVWTSGMSGITSSDKTISYYVKGPVVGFLLDAKIRRATAGAKSLDDMMKLAYQRYSGDRGFTAEQFRQTAEDVAGVDLKGWFQHAIASTKELDYTEALEWFGLQFAASDGKQAMKSWKLEMRKDATEAQKRRLESWLRLPLTPLPGHFNSFQGRRMSAEHPDIERRRSNIAEVVQRQAFFGFDECLRFVRQFQ
jgi:predicted metalloprotease with PDZ domain